jgi:hypothetical protein
VRDRHHKNKTTLHFFIEVTDGTEHSRMKPVTYRFTAFHKKSITFIKSGFTGARASEKHS